MGKALNQRWSEEWQAEFKTEEFTYIDCSVDIELDVAKLQNPDDANDPDVFWPKNAKYRGNVSIQMHRVYDTSRAEPIGDCWQCKDDTWAFWDSKKRRVFYGFIDKQSAMEGLLALTDLLGVPLSEQPLIDLGWE